MIATLPFELLAQIANDLLQQDILNCMCACHSWCNAFTPILYGRVVLSKGPKQFLHFVNALEQSPDLRHLVRSVQWCAEILSSTNVNAIARRCRYINAIMIAWTSRTCISPLSVSLETFSTLTRLKLEYRENGLGPKTAEYGSAKLASFLTSAPRLLALSLVNVIPLVRCIELISIHKACTELEHLDITCVHWDAKITDIRGIGPFPALRTLSITYERAGSQCTRFFADYLQKQLVPRYPNLKEVEFRRHSAYASQARQLLLWNDTVKRANFQGLRRVLSMAQGMDNARAVHALCSILPQRATYHLLLTTVVLSFTGFLHSDQNSIEIDTLVARLVTLDTLILETTRVKVSRSDKSFLKQLRSLQCKNIIMSVQALDYTYESCHHLGQIYFSVCRTHFDHLVQTSDSSSSHQCEPTEIHSIQHLRTIYGGKKEGCEEIFLIVACLSSTKL